MSELSLIPGAILHVYGSDDRVVLLGVQPDFSTCVHAASVCRSFESGRRRPLLAFTHHREVSGRHDADENLCGTKLSPSERAVFTRRRKEAYEAKHPETRHGGDRAASRQIGDLQSDRFTADTAKKTGHSERAVQRDAARAIKIDAAVLSSIAGTDLDKGVIPSKAGRA